MRFGDLGEKQASTATYDDDGPKVNSYAYHDEAEAVECPPHTTERKIVARIDWHVVPLLCIMYVLAFLDRINIANANVAGLSKDLHLTGDKYNVALVIFFVPYVLFEVPSNLLLKKLRPSVWLSINMFLFGFTTIMQGIVKSYNGLLVCRFFLGVFETGMFPGAFYLLGAWYKRSEGQKRFSFFFCSTTLAGAFGGLLAAAIEKMNGVAGYAGWRWIFILEGCFTVATAAVFFFALPNFPEQAKWLREDERAFVIHRLRIDHGKSALEQPISLKEVGRVFRDYKVFVAGLMYFGLIVSAYGYAYFSAGIIKHFGYSSVQTQLHSVPPWACAFVFAMIIATLSDWTKHRFFFAVLPICVCITGLAILVSVHNNTHLEYAALFLVAMGAYSAMPIIICWFNLNLGGHNRRAVGSAWQIGFGNTGGIIAVFAFLQKDAPKYVNGYSICLAFAGLSLLSCTVYWIACRTENKRKDSALTNVGLSEHEKTEMGDKSPDYRYLL